MIEILSSEFADFNRKFFLFFILKQRKTLVYKNGAPKIQISRFICFILFYFILNSTKSKSERAGNIRKFLLN